MYIQIGYIQELHSAVEGSRACSSWPLLIIDAALINNVARIVVSHSFTLHMVKILEIVTGLANREP